MISLITLITTSFQFSQHFRILSMRFGAKFEFPSISPAKFQTFEMNKLLRTLKKGVVIREEISKMYMETKCMVARASEMQKKRKTNLYALLTRNLFVMKGQHL